MSYSHQGMGSIHPTHEAGVTAHLRGPRNSVVQAQDTVRPLFQSRSSKYSIATAEAINRNATCLAYHDSQSIEALRMQRDAVEQAEVLPPRSDSLRNRGQYNAMFWQDESQLLNGSRRCEVEAQRLEAFDMLDGINPEVEKSATPPQFKSPKRPQRARSVSTVTPQRPPLPRDISLKRAASQRSRREPNGRPAHPPSSLAQISRAASQRTQRQHQRYNSRVSQASLGQDANSGIPPERRPSLGRRLSDSLQSMGRRFSDVIAAPLTSETKPESVAEKYKVKHIPNSDWYDARGEPPESWKGLISLPEARRKMADRTAEEKLHPAPFGRYDLNRSRILRHERRSIVPPQARTEVVQTRPAEPKMGMHARRLSGTTTFGAMIAAANRIDSPMPPPGSDDFPLIPQPLVPTIKRKPVPQREKPVPAAVNRDKSLPPTPPASTALQESSHDAPPPAPYAHDVMDDEGGSRATICVRPTRRSSSKAVIYIGLDIRMLDPRPAEPPSVLRSAEFASVKPITESEICSTLKEAERCADRSDMPTLQTQADIREHVVDTVPRDRRTSRMVTDRADDHTLVQKWHGRMPKQEQLPAPEEEYTDSARRLMRKLSMERRGQEVERLRSAASAMSDDVEDGSTIWSDPWVV